MATGLVSVDEVSAVDSEEADETDSIVVVEIDLAEVAFEGLSFGVVSVDLDSKSVSEDVDSGFDSDAACTERASGDVEEVESAIGSDDS